MYVSEVLRESVNHINWSNHLWQQGGILCPLNLYYSAFNHTGMNSDNHHMISQHFWSLLTRYYNEQIRVGKKSIVHHLMIDDNGNWYQMNEQHLCSVDPTKKIAKVDTYNHDIIPQRCWCWFEWWMDQADFSFHQMTQRACSPAKICSLLERRVDYLNEKNSSIIIDLAKSWFLNLLELRQVMP